MYWSRNARDLLNELGSNDLTGLDREAYQRAINSNGPNTLTEAKRISQLAIFLKQFHNKMSYLLLLAAGISFGLDEKIDAVAIFAIVILNGIVGYFQEAKAEAAIAALKRLSIPRAKVLREGKVELIDSMDVVPGDVLILEAGDYIVADAVVLNSFQLSADESILTGESMPVEKISGIVPEKTPLAERKNMLHSSTALTSGSGKALVVSTGMKTEIGKIASLLEATKTEDTPLQKKLEKVSNKLLIIGLIVMVIIAIIGYRENRGWLEIFMMSVSLAVAAIPEGLPTIVTLALTLAVRRMSKRNAIVRKMVAVEALGSTDIICTDKTGTLTTGNMIVRETFLLSQNAENEMKVAAVACNNASLDNGGSGDPTEIALLRMAVGEKSPPRLYEWSFDSDRKRMSVAVKHNEGAKIYCKGAPESVLPLCLISKEDSTSAEKAIREFSLKGQRILALATRELPIFDKNTPPSLEEAEKEFSFLGLVAIADPPKEETIPAIAACRASGIKVIMITGDHPLTAEAIAKELGIIDTLDSSLVMTGHELDSLDSDGLQERCEKVLVYARVSPVHKLRIVEALQKNGHTVAMTGDGVNDSPALKKASIGVAMGRSGTEVARQASNMILTDDNFATIVHAVEEGRAIFGNIKRTVQYLLSTNLAEILIVLGSVLLELPMPFVPLTLLWINLVTDGFPSLALAAEPVEKDFLKKNRSPSAASFFDKKFMKEMVFVGLLMTIIHLTYYDYELKEESVLMAKSSAFHLLVYLCLFRSFSCRSDHYIYSQLPLNKFHVISVMIPIALQITLENWSVFTEMFEISPIGFRHHFFLMLLSVIPVSLIEIRKLLKMRKRTPAEHN